MYELLQDSNYLDLKSFMKRRDYSTEIKIYYPKNDRLDQIHSLRLNSFKKVTLFGFESGDHNLVRRLRDNGELLTIIRSNLF